MHLPHRPRTGERLLMKTAIIGSRGIRNLRLEQFLPEDVSEIISGGARGVDALAAEYADIHEIPLKVFLPDYRRYGKKAPLVRNRLIVDACDVLFAFWDGASTGTAYTLRYARERGKEIHLFRLKRAEPLF